MTGEELYQRLHTAWADGVIGTPVIPWQELPCQEQQEWGAIAAQAGETA